MSTRVIVCTVRVVRESIFARLYRILCSLILAQSVHVWLVSEDMDPDTGEGKASAVSKLRLWWTKHEGPDSLVTMSFTVDQDFGKPAAVLLNSFYSTEFFLQSVTLHVMPDGFDVYFPCHTWVNHSRLYFGTPRVLFSNSPYLPNKTPTPIRKLRKSDLLAIRGDGSGHRLHGQRIYDYEVYNDLGNPDHSASLARPILGGSRHPYPRRCRTGRNPTETDAHSEKPAGRGSNAMYVPRDDMFSAIKKWEFLLLGLRSVGHNVFLNLEHLIRDDRSFLSAEQLRYLYDGRLGSRIHKAVAEWMVNHIIKRPTDGRPFLFPPPGVAKVHENAWDVDSEYGRQRLAGVNPLVIQRMESFPPISRLDPKDFGPPTSAITSDHLKPLLEGLSVLEALQQKRLYIVDYHDAFMPFINKINGKEITGKAIYAPRTIFYLRKNGPLIPIAIELCLPPTDAEEAKSRVFTADDPQWLWRLAKAHAATVDTGYHQLVSHWLHTHACVEPFVIATHRQLSTMHPVHMLLSPHFKDTMHINALARNSLINGGGKIESNFTPGRYCMEISSAVYKGWRFDEQALPKDLLKRGMAVEDTHRHGGFELTIENYPYAVDGLEVWAAIEQWVEDYVKLYYKNDRDVQEDEELKGWWEEVTKVGHGDHAGAEWWSEMKKVEDVIEVMTTLIWMASALHAAVNFGQYAYGGYMPNNPTMARLLIPEEGTQDYKDMLTNLEGFFFNTVSTQGTTTFAMAILEILASHMSEEEYLGDRKDPAHWSCDPRAIHAFNNFRGKLKEVGRAIERRNKDGSGDEADFRQGPAQLPYTLLHPSSPGPGLTFSGIPNSISI
ncbi:hypothetical protein GOP47_0021697 [Adiantum capillus-veneris]|uniref:Lipoxygenase n=1 Tax=Adiantum capillus-veneris TaxID=13818 RepID=A0A9D4U8L8_ADICA|nr:hypothetical protein GOP47_0021697 [Adiantum capillus-veneris]